MTNPNKIRNSKPEKKKKSSKAKANGNKKPKAPNPLWLKIKQFFLDERLHKTTGLILLLSSIYLFLSFTSYLFSWKNDQDLVNNVPFWSFVFSGEELDIRNWLGKLGAYTSHSIIYGGFGIVSFLLPFNFALWGIKILFKKDFLPLLKTLSISGVIWVWLSITLGYLFAKPYDFLGGIFGFETSGWIVSAIGPVGMVLFILFSGLVATVILFNPKIPTIGRVIPNKDEEEITSDQESNAIPNKMAPDQPVPDETSKQIELEEDTTEDIDEIEEVTEEGPEDLGTFIGEEKEVKVEVIDEEFQVEVPSEEDELSEAEISDKLKEFGEYDPKLVLATYQLPGIDLLSDHGGGNISVDKEELEENKNKIVETLG
ncbi:MAG: DNA translocase FtsK 4TM domain-containing protein, partial [Flavobacteriales bacterium]|nr:DNA translocase FtsK 4TM domain-containing protein [Flavobacteriales bacterium]